MDLLILLPLGEIEFIEFVNNGSFAVKRASNISEGRYNLINENLLVTELAQGKRDTAKIIKLDKYELWLQMIDPDLTTLKFTRLESSH